MEVGELVLEQAEVTPHECFAVSKRRSQKVEDFLDEDELEEMHKSGLQVRAEYDTFGSTAAEHARRAATAEASSRDRGHLTFVPDAIITPVADSMGGPPALSSLHLKSQESHAPGT